MMAGKPTARPSQAPKSMGGLYLPNEPNPQVRNVKAPKDKWGDQRKAQWPNEPKVGARSRVRTRSGRMGHRRSTKDEVRIANVHVGVRVEGSRFSVAGVALPFRVAAKRGTWTPQSAICIPQSAIRNRNTLPFRVAAKRGTWTPQSAIGNPQSEHAPLRVAAKRGTWTPYSAFRNPQSAMRNHPEVLMAETSGTSAPRRFSCSAMAVWVGSRR